MYFPKLSRLSEEGFEPEIIIIYDYWLGNLPGLKRNRIRPSRFAVDMAVDYNLSNELFSVAAVNLGILSINFEISCPYEDQSQIILIADELEKIPEIIRCPSCGERFHPFDNDEFIELSFNLIEPINPSKIGPQSTNRMKKPSVYNNLKKSKENQTLNVNTFFSSKQGRTVIERSFFEPDWDKFDVAFNRYKSSFQKGVTTEEKGKALEDISCLLLSFINFFSVDSTVSTITNQIDITVTLRPYFKFIEIPLLKIIGRRILCECKNEDHNVPSIWVDKLTALIKKTDNCKVGIVFSRDPFSGDDWRNAKASQIEHVRHGIYILSFTTDDFTIISKERPNVLYYLDNKFEELEMRVSRREKSS